MVRFPVDLNQTPIPSITSLLSDGFDACEYIFGDTPLTVFGDENQVVVQVVNAMISLVKFHMYTKSTKYDK